MSASADGESPGAAGRDRLPREVWLLVAANVVVAAGYGVVAPVLPQYARDFGVSIGAATFVITAFAALRLLGAPPAGLLVQRLGERRVYLTGLLVVALSTLACAAAQTYEQLLLFRSLGGLGSAMFTVSSLGLTIRISPPGARGRVAGLFASGFLVGSVCGPLLGSLTAGLGLAAPFLVYGVALLVAATVVFVFLRGDAVTAPQIDAGATVSLRAMLRRGSYRSALLSNFATGWASFGLRIALVPLYVVEGLGRSPGVAGLALATFAVGNVCAVVPAGRLSDRIGRRVLLIGGLTVSAVTTAAVGLSSSLTVFLVAAFVTGAATGAFVAPQQAAVADVMGGARGGTAVAAFQMAADVGSIVGSLVIGQVAEHLSYPWAFAVSGLVLLAAAVAWVLAPETRPPSAVLGRRRGVV